jgi:uncharacterized membrane protein YfcA
MRVLFTLAAVLSCFLLAAMVGAGLGHLVVHLAGWTAADGDKALWPIFTLSPLVGLAGAIAGGVIGWRAAKPPVPRRARWALAGVGTLAVLAMVLG